MHQSTLPKGAFRQKVKQIFASLCFFPRQVTNCMDISCKLATSGHTHRVCGSVPCVFSSASDWPHNLPETPALPVIFPPVSLLFPFTSIHSILFLSSWNICDDGGSNSSDGVGHNIGYRLKKLEVCIEPMAFISMSAVSVCNYSARRGRQKFLTVGLGNVLMPFLESIFTLLLK